VIGIIIPVVVGHVDVELHGPGVFSEVHVRKELGEDRVSRWIEAIEPVW
jgi:hypothetical protein